MSTFRSTNPARPAEVVIELPEHGEADVDQAVQRAAEAQRAWAARRWRPSAPSSRPARASWPSW